MKAGHAIAAAWRRRGSPTRLADAFIAAVGARSLDDLLEGLALERYHLDASAAPLVFQVAQSGDAVAQQVVAWSARELGDLAAGVIRQLGFERLSFAVVRLGGMYNAGPLLLEPLRATIHAVAPGARLTRLDVPPVVGGVLLGMQQAGHDPRLARAALVRSVAQLPLAAGQP